MEKIDDAKDALAEITNPDNIKGSLADALIDADVFVGVSAPGILKPEMVRAMNKDAIIFAMANPTPEIMPDEAKAAGARVIGTGRSDFPNQVNNVLAFPGIFRGALDVRAKRNKWGMKLAAAYAIAGYIRDEDLNENNVIPSALDKNVATKVAEAIANAARESGVARK